MSTTITSVNGVEIKVAQLGMGVVHPEGITSIWARLSDAQRVELAAALDPGRRGLHVRLDNQAATLATYRRECDEALRKKGEMVDRAVRAEQELGELRSKVNAWGRERPAPAVSRADIDRALINVTSNAMNYPNPSQMLGKDTGPLRRKCVDAVCDLFGVEAEQAVDPIMSVIRDGLNVWGTTDEGVRQIAESVRRAISSDGSENAL